MTQQRNAKGDLEFLSGLSKVRNSFTWPILEYWIQEAERMRARADQLASESSSQFVSTTNALMRAEAAEQELEAQRIRADKAEEEMTSLQEMVDGANTGAVLLSLLTTKKRTILVLNHI